MHAEVKRGITTLEEVVKETRHDGRRFAVGESRPCSRDDRAGRVGPAYRGGRASQLRVDGDIVSSSAEAVLTPKDTLSIAYSCSPRPEERFETENEPRFSFASRTSRRFRATAQAARCVSLVIPADSLQRADLRGAAAGGGKPGQSGRAPVLVTGPHGLARAPPRGVDQQDQQGAEGNHHVRTRSSFIHRHRAAS